MRSVSKYVIEVDEKSTLKQKRGTLEIDTRAQDGATYFNPTVNELAITFDNLIY